MQRADIDICCDDIEAARGWQHYTLTDSVTAVCLVWQGAIIIHEVYADGAAARDGRLWAGDQILEVSICHCFVPHLWPPLTSCVQCSPLHFPYSLWQSFQQFFAVQAAWLWILFIFMKPSAYIQSLSEKCLSSTSTTVATAEWMLSDCLLVLSLRLALIEIKKTLRI